MSPLSKMLTHLCPCHFLGNIIAVPTLPGTSLPVENKALSQIHSLPSTETIVTCSLSLLIFFWFCFPPFLNFLLITFARAFHYIVSLFTGTVFTSISAIYLPSFLFLSFGLVYFLSAFLAYNLLFLFLTRRVVCLVLYFFNKEIIVLNLLITCKSGWFFNFQYF